jgi:hypothetical protein
METRHVGCYGHNAAALPPRDDHARGVGRYLMGSEDLTIILIYGLAESTKMKGSKLFSYIFTH